MKNVYTVKQVNSYIKNMFTQDFMLNRIYVKGEVSNLKYHTSGHIYFSLKDESGTIACVMFAGSRSGLSFHMEEGQQVVVLGAVSVYERDGRYQLYAREIILDGAGLLYERFEALKKELEEMGKRVPEDLQIIGYDGLQFLNQGKPIVSSICQPVHKIAKQAVKSLTDMIENGKAEDVTNIPVMFHEGPTTKPLETISE